MDKNPKYVMAIDQGTTSTRAMIFDDQGQMITTAQKEFTQYFPDDGWVEHDAMEIIDTVMDTAKGAIGNLPEGSFPSALGITNQRETTVIWDRKTGLPIHKAIVWQDRRTAEHCAKLKDLSHEDLVTEKTGLLLDPYFSATKISWILDHVPNARRRAEEGELAFGTIDSFILWHLTGGESHATDITNASRTLLFNIRNKKWDTELLNLFNVPAALLPKVYACDHYFGDTGAELFGHIIPITAVAGDQHAAMIGQRCFEPGDIKCTYGTGGFVMMNVGDEFIRSKHRLLTTIAFEIQGKMAYAIEGSFFCAGSAVQWLRDGLKVIQSAGETEKLTRSINNNGGVYMVPAFTGLGAPHWNPEARGAFLGLTRATGVAEMVRATLESVVFQTTDLLEVMQQDTGISVKEISVDGGMVQNDWLIQFLADMSQIDVHRPQVLESTAYGIAMLAGLKKGILRLENLTEFAKYEGAMKPKTTEKEAIKQKNSWKRAVKTICYYSGDA